MLLDDHNTPLPNDKAKRLGARSITDPTQRMKFNHALSAHAKKQ
jgi:hypothetical protein